MNDCANEWVAYFIGEIVPESRPLVSFRDRGFKYGDAVFDTTRTVRHESFKLVEHVQRLFRSMGYLDIDPGMGVEDFARHSKEALKRNLHLIGPGVDYWIFQRASPGTADRSMAGRRA